MTATLVHAGPSIRLNLIILYLRAAGRIGAGPLSLAILYLLGAYAAAPPISRRTGLRDADAERAGDLGGARRLCVLFGRNKVKVKARGSLVAQRALAARAWVGLNW